MADFKDNDNDASIDEFADDLDAMLNDAESSIDEQGGFIDDEDAIDRLLMDDEFDGEDDLSLEAKQDSSNDEIDVDDLIDAVDETAVADVDEFSESDDSASASSSIVDAMVESDDESAEDQINIDDVIDAVAEPDSTIEQADEFAEIDEFSEDEPAVTTDVETEEPGDDEFDVDDLLNASNEEAVDESSEKDAESDDAFLMADFDISSGEEDDVAIEEELDNNSEEPEPEPEPELPVVAEKKAVKEIVHDNAAIDQLKSQVSQLLGETEELKQKLAELVDSNAPDEFVSDEIETLQKEQRKVKKLIQENANKTPVITYVAIGIAVIALLVGSILGAIGYSAQSEVDILTELVTTLEEEIEIIATKDLSKEIDKVEEKTDLKYKSLVQKNEQLDTQLLAVNQKIQKNKLKPILDDLIVQNNHAQEAIESLLAKVEELEKRKVQVVRAKRIKKVVPKILWEVNLVSYKQEWYASRKVVEFEKKGISADVIKVKVDGKNWFRLRVKGFKSQYEAAAYAVKVKKLLNLSSVWVTKS